MLLTNIGNVEFPVSDLPVQREPKNKKGEGQKTPAKILEPTAKADSSKSTQSEKGIKGKTKGEGKSDDKNNAFPSKGKCKQKASYWTSCVASRGSKGGGRAARFGGRGKCS